MLFKIQKSFIARLALILALLGGMLNVIPVRASTEAHKPDSKEHHALLDAPGTLDTTFDGDGLIATTFGTDHSEGRTIAIQPDGKIIAAGYRISDQLDFAVVRYNSNGSLDTSFDTDGKVTTDFADGGDYAQGIAIQPDGKIVVAGRTSFYNIPVRAFAIVRYNSNGSLDTSFDTDGKVTTNFGGMQTDSGYAIAIQSDGKIVVAGSTKVGFTDYDIAIARYNSNGSLDNTFDGDGLVTTAISSDYESAETIAIQPDGKIIVGGMSGIDNTVFALVRYNSNGSLDTNFSTDGIATTDFSNGYDYARDLALQSDGKIVLAGFSDDYYVSLARYNSNGVLDNTFDTDGKVRTYFGYDAEATSIAIQTNGKLVLAGASYATTNYDFLVLRYNQNGSLDTSFDGDGKLTTDFGSNRDDLANAVAIQSDGGIVVSGYRSIDGSNNDFAVARYFGDETSNNPLTVIKNGTGAGIVTSNPAGINCGLDCSESYPANTLVALSATPATGSTFTGWSGDCSGTGTCTVTMTAAESVTASFASLLPGSATLVSPNANITDTKPTYTWNAVLNAEWYYLWVNSSTTSGFIKQWYTADQVGCAGGTGICSIEHPTALGAGAHTWWIQTWNSSGYGPWSTGLDLTVTLPPPPGVASPVSPNTTTTDTMPTYTWNAVSGAEWYHLWVKRPSGDPIKHWYEASAICTGGTCAIEHPADLGAGAHTWWVQTWNVGGYGPWSAGMNFTVNPPGAATLVSPNSSANDANPTYTWNAVSGADWYYLWVSKINSDGSLTTMHTKWYDATAVCSGATCSITPAGITLTFGNYRWWIQTWNEGGYGPWSSAMNFTVIP